MTARVLVSVLGAVLAAAACVEVSTDHFLLPSGTGGGASGHGGRGAGGDAITLDSGTGCPPSEDAGGFCGNTVHQITQQPPTVYFIFDISGSMAEPVAGGTKYSVVQAAAAGLVKDLRFVIKAGAAAFPLDTSLDPCNPGGEIFPPHFNDPIGFGQATGFIQPYGGTPTAATLKALLPKLTALPGKVIAVLATDGGPNCNASATCDISECGENIDGCPASDTCCAQGQNCCLPGGTGGPTSCIDHAPTVSAVAAIAAAGVKVYVVGIPGSQPYAKVLTDMAFAGGAVMPAAPFYYDVQDLGTLGDVFKAIAGAQVSCDITVDNPPNAPGDTNVYFGCALVLYDPVDGWTWSAPNVVTLHGAACLELQSGAVSQVQVVSGCPTQGAQ
jgi:hypothetical protein